MGGFVMQRCYAIAASASLYDGNGRGGIRTHGGFPHARFRVECLKPDSATLPPKQKKRRTRNVQHTTSNATVSRLGVQRWALDVERLSSGQTACVACTARSREEY